MDLDGTFEKTSAGFGQKKMVYSNQYHAEGGQDKLLNQCADLETQLREKKNELTLSVQKSLKSLLPGRFDTAQVTIKNGRIDFTCDCPGLTLLVQENKAPKCPYQDIKHHHDFKSIMSSGVLTKAEKRKVLGLPVQTEREKGLQCDAAAQSLLGGLGARIGS